MIPDQSPRRQPFIGIGVPDRAVFLRATSRLMPSRNSRAFVIPLSAPAWMLIVQPPELVAALDELPDFAGS